MRVHDLKCAPEFFAPVASGRKPFEVRLDDRGFAVGDELRLREWVGEYTGAVVSRRVTFILRDTFPGLQPGWVAMGLA